LNVGLQVGLKKPEGGKKKTMKTKEKPQLQEKSEEKRRGKKRKIVSDVPAKKIEPGHMRAQREGNQKTISILRKRSKKDNR